MEEKKGKESHDNHYFSCARKSQASPEALVLFYIFCCCVETQLLGILYVLIGRFDYSKYNW